MKQSILLRASAFAAFSLLAAPELVSQESDAKPAPKAAGSSEADQKQDPAAKFAAAKVAMLEAVGRGKPSKELETRMRAGFSFMTYAAELFRYKAELSALMSSANEAIKNAADKPQVDPSKRDAILEVVVAHLSGDREARAKLLADPATAKGAIRGVSKRVAAIRSGLLIGFVNQQAQTGARFIGQYAQLRALGPDILDLALDVMDSTQKISEQGRATLIVGIRDFVRKPKITPKQIERVEGFIDDDFEDPRVISGAIAALAYAGHTKHYDAKVAELEKAASEATGQVAIDNYSELADLHSIAEKNKAASLAYEKLIAAAKGLNPVILGSHFYNLACSFEKSGSREKALVALDKSLELGKENLKRGTLWMDRDILAIRVTEAFDKLLEKHSLEWPEVLKPRRDAERKAVAAAAAAAKKKAEAAQDGK